MNTTSTSIKNLKAGDRILFYGRLFDLTTSAVEHIDKNDGVKFYTCEIKYVKTVAHHDHFTIANTMQGLKGTDEVTYLKLDSVQVN